MCVVVLFVCVGVVFESVGLCLVLLCGLVVRFVGVGGVWVRGVGMGVGVGHAHGGNRARNGRRRPRS